MSYTCSPPDGCGERFASLADFDRHMMRDRAGWPHCKTPSALIGCGWQRDTAGVWRSPRSIHSGVRVRTQSHGGGPGAA